MVSFSNVRSCEPEKIQYQLSQNQTKLPSFFSTWWLNSIFQLYIITNTETEIKLFAVMFKVLRFHYYYFYSGVNGHLKRTAKPNPSIN